MNFIFKSFIAISLLLCSSGLLAQATPEWVVTGYSHLMPADAPVHFEGDPASVTDADPGTSFDVVWEEVWGGIWGPQFRIYLSPVDGIAKAVSTINIRLHVGGATIEEADLTLSIIEMDKPPRGPVMELEDISLSNGQVITWNSPEPLPIYLEQIVIEIDALRYFDNGALNNPIGFAEVEPLIASQSPIHLHLYPGSLQSNGEGWYTNNPVQLTLTMTNRTDEWLEGDLTLHMGSDDDKARFYIYDKSLELGDHTYEEHSAYSAKSYDFFYEDAAVAPGSSFQLTWNIWIQPSEITRLRFTATWVGEQAVEELDIPQAEIHPVVLIHGILGSMPPRYTLATSLEDAEEILDPFLGVYIPLPKNLMKMGYQWGKTLFALTYDWRYRNEFSAIWLATALSDHVIPASQEEGYVKKDGKADLITHSMGGLVARSYIQRDVLYKDNVRRVIFSATPHKGFPFDYQTWEGLTWHDYLNDAAFKSGWQSVLELFDHKIWPSLAVKKYRQGLSAEEFEQKLMELEAEGKAVYYGRLSDVIARLRGYYCWVKSPTRSGSYGFWKGALGELVHDPERGVHSLQQMLPTTANYPYSLHNYLADQDTGESFPYGKEDNSWLDNLNGNIDRLATELGLENIFTLYGNGLNTDVRYRVIQPHPSGDIWRYGEVPWSNRNIEEPSLGDNLIPWWSMALNKRHEVEDVLLPGLPEENEAEVQGAGHLSILYHEDTHKIWIPGFLAGVEAPFKTDYSQPWVKIKKSLAVSSGCPVNLMITAPDGKRLGYDPSTGSVLREIEDAVYTTPNVEPQIILVPEPVEGEYRITVYGYGQGAYSVEADAIYNPGGLYPFGYFGGDISEGDIVTLELTVDLGTPPVAADDNYELDEDDSLSVDAPGVLANDGDDDGDALSSVLISQPNHGMLALDTDGSFVYAPDTNFNGSDSFSYKANDGELDSNVATVTLIVHPVPDPPVAVDDQFVTEEDSLLAVGVPGILSNDSDADGDDLTTLLGNGPSSGSLHLEPEGSFLYTPAADFYGLDYFTYRVNDGTEDSNTARVTIQVTPVNDEPVAVDDVYRIDFRGELHVPAPGPLANDLDAENEPLTAVLKSEPSHGTVVLHEDGSFVYTRGAFFEGVDRFTYSATDGELESNEAVVTLRPALDCEELYGVSSAEDALLQIDPVTGAGTLIGALGIAVETVGLDFDREGRLWGFSQSEANRDQGILYKIDLITGAAEIVRTFDIGGYGGEVGIEFGPNGKNLFWLSGSALSILDIEKGEIIPFADLPFSGDSLTLPGRCRDFLSFDEFGYRLMRVSSFDGAVEAIGHSGIAHGIDSLAGAPDGRVFGHGSGRLYEFDVMSGEATLIGEIGFDTPGLAFLPTYRKQFCLDARYNRKTGLSRYVVEMNEKVRHLNRCRFPLPSGRKNCPTCESVKERCGKCGSAGYYLLMKGALLTLRTPKLQNSGTYRLRFQVRSERHRKPSLAVRIGKHYYELAVNRPSWHWMEPILVDLDEGENRIELANLGKGPLDIEGVRLEKACPGLLQGEKLNACLDRRFDHGSGLSQFVVSTDGKVGHIGFDGLCGCTGSYYVWGESARIVAQLEIPETGRYLFRFRYRSGGKTPRDVSLRAVVGGRSFDLRNGYLEKTMRWEWSPKLEVKLEKGPQFIELISIGSDIILLENVELERVCECGGM